MDEVQQFLKLPPVARVKYKRNFIHTAVCELRFPTLLELEAKPPSKFQSKIRKNYPFYEPEVFEQIGGPDGISREIRYLFRSKDHHWTISVKSFALAVETSKYLDFEDFFSKFSEILDIAKELIDSDFFTRVGLRYINRVPIEDGKLDGWIRSDLVLPVIGGALGTVGKFISQIHGRMDRGQYAFRHALESIDAKSSTINVPTYILDMDYSKENVEFEEVAPLIKYFNETNFAFFSWCLGDKAKAYLGEGQPK